jgi:O-antigen/teichoic acid export membrane protein
MRSSFTNYALVNYVTNQIDRAPDTLLPLIVVNQLGPDAGAYFYVAWTMGRAMGLWASAVADSFFAEGSNDPAQAPTYAWRSVKLGLFLTGGLTLAMVLGGKLVLSIYGPNYVEQSAVLLYWMAFASVFEVLQSIFASYLRIQNRLGMVFVALSVSNTLGILTSWAGIVWLDLTGAGIGWLVSQAATLVGLGTWWRWKQARPHKQGPKFV